MATKRVRFVRSALLLLVLILVVRLVQVQVLESSRYQAEASHELAVPVSVPALRGGLYSRDGQVLSLSVPTDDVYADDFLIKYPRTEAAAMAPILHTSVGRLAEELHQPSGYVLLAKNVSDASAQKLDSDQFPGVTLVADSERIVPNGNLGVTRQRDGQRSGPRGVGH